MTDAAQAQQPPALSAEDRRHKQQLVRSRLVEFVEPFDSLEPWYQWDTVLDRWEPVAAGYHASTMPPLLTQLVQAASGTAHAAGAVGTFESRPAASIDAIDALTRIERKARDLAKRLRAENVGSTAANLRLLADRARELPDGDLVILERHVRGWWVAARIVAGFEERPQTPHARCPRCETQDSIKVRIDVTGKFGLGWCRSCGADWDEDSFGILVRHIRGEAERADGDGDD